MDRTPLPLLLVLLAVPSCGNGDGDDDDSSDGDTDVDTDADTDADGGLGFHLGTFALDTYATPYVGDYGGDDTIIVSCSGGEPIATVPADFVTAIETERRGKLLDGRVVVPGLAGGCYELLPPDVEWGLGIEGRPLTPYRSAAAHAGDVALDKWLYIPQLVGVTLPGEGDAHDGCVRFDDERNDVETRHFAFFIGLASREGAVRDAIGGGGAEVEVDAYQDSPECYGWDL